MIRLFSDVYQKSLSTLQSARFNDADWQPIINGLRILLATDGPNINKCAALDELRAKLNQVRLKNPATCGPVASTILALCGEGEAQWQDRVALIKFLMHFYLIGRRGGQAIWIADLPENFHYWPYDMFQFQSGQTLVAMIEDRKEFFGGNTRELMSNSFQQARKWAVDAQVKLSSPSTSTLQKVKQWFHLPDTKEDSVRKTAHVLHDGFKKIHMLCNQKQVIFSNFPVHRINSDFDETIAMVSYSDSMTVLYFYKKFNEYGKRDILKKFGASWQAALTIIHELSHLAVKTEDRRYAFRGIQPGRKLSEGAALVNADSWAFFAADLAGLLSQADFDRVYRETMKN